jgi:hypothetical protein
VRKSSAVFFYNSIITVCKKVKEKEADLKKRGMLPLHLYASSKPHQSSSMRSVIFSYKITKTFESKGFNVKKLQPPSSLSEP